MRFVRGSVIIAYGMVSIAAQTLLFREFVTVFEGNDISVGVFFASWFLWVGLGAALVRRRDRLVGALAKHIELAFLLYVPAFLGQLLLILHVRDLAGLASYDLVPVQTTVLWSIGVNAPVSLITGLLFPAACRWVERTHAFPVSRVYILEAVGSLAGGLAVTALLFWHVPMVRIALLLAVALSIAVLLSGFWDGRRIALALPAVTIVLAATILLTGNDRVLTHSMQTAEWSRLLPREALRGAFQTTQAEYLYGQYSDQWIAMREGSVCETLPGEEEAGRTAATVLCQNPSAGRILVIGSGLGLCDRFLRLPQVMHVAWAHPDTEYAERLLQCLPDEFAVKDSRFHPVADEVRGYLAGARSEFDAVVLNLSDAAGSAFNRYYTVEFYERVKASLRPGGAVAVSIAGGEDVLGAEMVGLGASTRTTLAKVFAHQILVPGEQTWLIASDEPGLTTDPAVARDRFAGIAGSQQIFPAAGLLSVYLPDRIAEATLVYSKANLPEELLINRDSRPLAHLYGLLLAARQSGASVTRFVKLLALGGWLPFLVPALVFVVLRVLAMADRGPQAGPSGFDSAFLVLSTGWVGIAMTILLMYLYETHFGSLFLHIGLISSLFMAGLTLGAVLVGVLIARLPGRRFLHSLLLTILLIHAAVLAFLASGWIDQTPGHGLFALAFILSGLSCGGYWPIAAAQLAAGSLDPGRAGGRLETADHLGACLGGLATSLLMVPVLGTRVSLLILISLVLTNLPAAVLGLRSSDASKAAPAAGGVRLAGYGLFGLCAYVVLCSNVLTRASERLQPTLPVYAINALAAEHQVRHESATLSSGRRADYVTILDPNQMPVGYVLSSADFAPEVRGFGGRFNLAVYADASGKLADLLIVRSNETPSYLDSLRDWFDSLKGKNVFDAEALAGVNAVAGATVSSEAVLAALRTSGGQFAAEVLKSGPQGRTHIARSVDVASLSLAATALLAFVAAWIGRAWGRVLVLITTFLLGGVYLNAQYSTEQIATLLSLDIPRAGLTGAFLLVVGVPILVLLFGNLYCGYLCPFGAAQELLGYVLPRRLRPKQTRDPMRAARFIKYIVLAVFVVGFFIARDRRTLGSDPLTSVFVLNSAPSRSSMWMPAIAGAALVGSLFSVRFWCRYLCPAGAFLSLLNRVRLLRRLIPAKRFGLCEFGLNASDHLDCLYCDRCRHEKKSEISDLRSQRAFKTPLVLATVLLGLLVSGLSIDQLRSVMPQILQGPIATTGAGGKPRDVDVKQVRTLIEQGRLSDREAEHYKRVE